MKIKTQLTLASVIAVGLMASGCSGQQMVAQQAAPAVAAPVVEPIPQTTTMVKEIIDCSGCHRPAPAPRPQPKPRGNMHSHPAIAGCTDAVRHNHPHPQGGRHSHKYNCKKSAPRRPAPRPAPRANPDAHSHPAVPNCTRAISHVHANGRRAHQHRHACQRPVVRPAPRPVYRPAPRPIYRPAPQPVMPKVKAKGTYKGPIKIDGVMKQYQQ